jgi:hypothetical protein
VLSRLNWFDHIAVRRAVFRSRTTRLASVGLWLLAIPACDVQRPTVPDRATPTPANLTPTNLVISGLPSELTVGQVVSLSTQITLPDQLQKDVTQETTWRTSSDAVATISSGGLLTVKDVGDANVTATYQNLTATGHLVVTRPRAPSPTFRVTGLVHEPESDGNAAVANVRIEVEKGELAGRVFATDDRGSFALPPVTTADFWLYFKKDGYDDTRFWVRELPRDQTPDVEFLPQGLVTQKWSGTLERGDIGPVITNVLKGWPGDVVFQTYRSGSVTLQLEVGCVAAGTYTDFGFGVWSVPAHVEVLSLWAISGPQGPPYRVSGSALLPPGGYRLSGFANGYLGSPCPWSLTFSRPY